MPKPSIYYALTEHSKIGASGTWTNYDRDRSYQVLSSVPYMTQNIVGSPYYSYQLSARNTVGLQAGRIHRNVVPGLSAYSLILRVWLRDTSAERSFQHHAVCRTAIHPEPISHSHPEPCSDFHFDLGSGWNRLWLDREIAPRCKSRSRIRSGMAPDCQAFEMTTGTLRLTRQIT